MRTCRGEGYDGAANMAGQCSGTPKFIQSKAFYCYCAAHKLNLCIAHFCKLTSVANMMDGISSFASFLILLQKSKAHWKSTFASIQIP